MTSASTEDKLINQYRYRRLGNGFLVTTDHGLWVFLSRKMFGDLRSDNFESLPEELFKEKGIIVDEKAAKNIEKYYRKIHRKLFHGISRHVIHTRGMSKDTVQKLIEFVPSGKKTIQFAGGVDMKTAQNIIVHTDNARFEIVTGEMDNYMLDFLKKNKIDLTFYGNIKEVGKIKGTNINAILYVTRDILDFPGIVKGYHEMGLSSVWIRPIHKMDKNWEKQGYSSEEYLRFWKQALDYFVKMDYFVERSTLAILKKITAKDFIAGDNLCSPCPAAVQELAYNEKGDIFVCHASVDNEDFKIGNVKTHRYSNVVKSTLCQTIIKSSINDNSVCRICAYKPYCGLCPFGSFAETGNIIPRLPDRRCRILKGMFDHIFMKLIYDEEYRKVFDKWISL